MLRNIFFITLFLCNSHLSFSQTFISGQIRNDTTWTKAGSPYILSDLIEIAPGTTLTIEPGTEIRIGRNIEVYGCINANGTVNDTIRFTSKDGQMPCDIAFLQHTLQKINSFKYCSFNKTNVGVHDVVNLSVENCYLSESTISGGKAILFIKNNSINGGDVILNGPDSTILINNVLKKGYLAVTGNKYTAIINNNISDGNNGYGIYCKGSGIKVIQDNTVTKATIAGILLADINLDTTFHVSGNTLTNNNVGLHIRQCIGTVSNNSIYQNDIGLWYDRYSTGSDDIRIVDNCINDNKIYNFYNYAPTAYHIDKNWWGTADSVKIDSLIFDYVDDFKKGIVTFMPVLSKADSSCKKYIPSNISAENSIEQKITISPNPFTNMLIIETSNPEELLEIALYDILGKRVQTINNVKMSRIIMDTGNLSKGVYIYKVLYKNRSVQTGKVIHQ